VVGGGTGFYANRPVKQNDAYHFLCWRLNWRPV